MNRVSNCRSPIQCRGSILRISLSQKSIGNAANYSVQAVAEFQLPLTVCICRWLVSVRLDTLNRSNFPYTIIALNKLQQDVPSELLEAGTISTCSARRVRGNCFPNNCTVSSSLLVVLAIGGWVGVGWRPLGHQELRPSPTHGPRRLRSADTHKLLVSRTRTNFGDMASSTAGPRVWNYICRQTSDSCTYQMAVSDSRWTLFS